MSSRVSPERRSGRSVAIWSRCGQLWGSNQLEQMPSGRSGHLPRTKSKFEIAASFLRNNGETPRNNFFNKSRAVG
ncbi:MAG TPA: hypothetical protein ENL22_09515 [candidate division Zixibacteria bacterium]|nr:hypothetical protein [candidate division Zixibacteria bacterium]